MTYGTHLRRRRHGTLYFRFVVPPDLRGSTGKGKVPIMGKAFRYGSAGTSYVAGSLTRARFCTPRGTGSPLSYLTQASMKGSSRP